MRSLYDAIQLSTSIDAQADSGGSAVNGAVVDTAGFNTAVLRARVALSSGSPTTASTVVKLQECDTSNGTFTDALDNTGVVIGGTVNSKLAAGEVIARIEGLGSNRKKFLRITQTTTYTGGTTPATVVFGEIILGRAYTNPVNSAVSNT